MARTQEIEGEEYYPAPEVEIHTDVGRLVVHASGAGQLYVKSPDRYKGEHTLLIRGIEYTAGGHFHRWADGSWQVGAEDQPPGVRYSSLSVNRPSNWGKEPSKSAREAVVKVMQGAIEEALAVYPTLVLEGNQAHLLNQLSSKRRALREKAEEVAALEREIDELENAVLATMEGATP